MILSAQSIAFRCARRPPPLIEPFYAEKIIHQTGTSFGLTAAGYDIRVREEVSIPMGGFMLASSVEHFNMPDDLLGLVKDKSTWARMGLAVQNTVIEPGWRGYLTLELTSHRDMINLPAGSPIAQVVFELLDHPTFMPYSGKYQNQRIGAVDAVFEQPTEEPR